MIRVLIADDQALVRGGFRSILETQPDIEVVGEAEDGQDAVEQAARHRAGRRRHGHPDAAPRRHRRDVGDPRRHRSPPKVLILTTFDLDDYVYDALRAGASGFLLKSAPPRELADAIRTVAAGDALLAPEITRRLIEDYVARPRRAAARRRPSNALTPREAEVMMLIARGLLQRRDRRSALPLRADREDPRHPGAGQARRPRPGARGRARLRVRARAAGRRLRPRGTSYESSAIGTNSYDARQPQPRLTAEMTAFSEAVTMLASRPTPQRMSSPHRALDVRRRDRVAAGGEGVLGVVEHPDVEALGEAVDRVDEGRERSVAGALELRISPST